MTIKADEKSVYGKKVQHISIRILRIGAANTKC